MIFKTQQFTLTFILSVALLGRFMLASKIEDSVFEPVGRQAKSGFNKMASDFIEMITAKLASGEYVMTPREELVYTLVLDTYIQREKEKRDKLRKAFMHMRHGR